MDVEWDECEAFAQHVGDDGKERIVFCSLGRHAAPGDSTVKHYDPDLDVFWIYAEDWLAEDN